MDGIKKKNKEPGITEGELMAPYIIL